jgi:hypothetical protein
MVHFLVRQQISSTLQSLCSSSLQLRKTGSVTLMTLMFRLNFVIVIYTISGIKAILQDSSVKIADDEGVSPSSSVITRVSCNML